MLSKTIRILLLAAGIFPAPATVTAGENWLLVEALVFPSGCAPLATCLQNSTAEVRNLMAMDGDETLAFLDILATLANVKDVPDFLDARSFTTSPLVEIIPRLAVLDVTPNNATLAGLPGIYFDATRVAGEGVSDRFIAEFTTMLTAANIPILTEAQAAALPGAAKMSISLSETRDNAGCIFPFRASLTLKEQVVLVRDPNIKIETTTWTAGISQNFTNTNYGSYAALMDAAQKFVDAYKGANAT